MTAARAWIFEVAPEKLPSILRHGDVAAVPVRQLPVGERKILWDELCGCPVIDADYLIADQAVEIHGRIYAKCIQLVHSKGQHADVAGVTSHWYRIQVGLRAETHWFSRPTTD